MDKYQEAFLNTDTFLEKRPELEKFYQSSVENLKLKTDDGYTITAAHLVVDKPIDTLVIIPGRGEIAHKFCEFFYTLSKLHIQAYVIFARGQATSTRLLDNKQKCHINKFEDFAKDVSLVLEKQNISNYKLLAFSLGGLVSLDIIKNGQNKPSKAALIAPYIWPYFKLNAGLLKALAFTLGTLPLTNTMYTPHGREYKRLEFIGNHHSHDKSRFEYYHEYFSRHPNYTIGGPTYKFVKEAMKKQLELLHSKFEFSMPIYCQSAGEDKVVKTAVAKEFFERHLNDKIPPKFEVIENAYHDIINESDEYRIRPLSKALEFLFENNQEEK